MDHLLFNSLTDPIPGIRGELDIIPIHHEGRELLYFHDMLGYATDNFVLDRSIGPLMVHFTGRRTVNEILDTIHSQDGSDIAESDLLHFVRFLDQNRILRSTYFKKISERLEREFESQDVRPAVTAGNSYPSDPAEIRRSFDKAFLEHDGVSSNIAGGNIKALYAPHIDPRVGMSSYVKAFAPLKTLQPKRVVLLATSHYAGLYHRHYLGKPFILSEKNFETPLGLVENDRQSVRKLAALKNAGITASDRAHRIEHSIELHLIFLKYLWAHDFSLVPILVGSLDDLLYMQDGDIGKKMSRLGDTLNEMFGTDPETLFLISGDLAHFGQKFGDKLPASTYFDEVHQFDRQLLDAAEKGVAGAVLDVMKTNNDQYRICGFPPLITFLSAVPGLEGIQTSYDLWDERERQSAVTFGSILYTCKQ